MEILFILLVKYFKEEGYNDWLMLGAPDQQSRNDAGGVLQVGLLH